TFLRSHVRDLLVDTGMLVNHLLTELFQFRVSRPLDAQFGDAHRRKSAAGGGLGEQRVADGCAPSACSSAFPSALLSRGRKGSETHCERGQNPDARHHKSPAAVESSEVITFEFA